MVCTRSGGVVSTESLLRRLFTFVCARAGSCGNDALRVWPIACVFMSSVGPPTITTPFCSHVAASYTSTTVFGRVTMETFFNSIDSTLAAAAKPTSTLMSALASGATSAIPTSSLSTASPDAFNTHAADHLKRTKSVGGFLGWDNQSEEHSGQHNWVFPLILLLGLSQECLFNIYHNINYNNVPLAVFGMIVNAVQFILVGVMLFYEGFPLDPVRSFLLGGVLFISVAKNAITYNKASNSAPGVRALTIIQIIMFFVLTAVHIIMFHSSMGVVMIIVLVLIYICACVAIAGIQERKESMANGGGITGFMLGLITIIVRMILHHKPARERSIEEQSRE